MVAKAAVVAALAGMALVAQSSCWAQGSRDALFGDDEDSPKAKAGASATKPETGSGSPAFKGFVQLEAARTTEEPRHWSKLRTRGEFGGQGALGDGLKWKANVRLDYDAVFDVNSFYPSAVAHDQRTNATLRETYLDASAGDWDFRLGRQHVVWGEMVGLFFADVVSARDLREFILPDFDMLRTPQWAARAEYFKDDFHAELLWVPVASYDDIGKPGAEFYPYQPVLPGFVGQYRNEVRPARNLGNGNYGLRLTTLRGGWDMSAFHYRSMDIAPTFYRETVLAPVPTMTFEARHERIAQTGGTVAKDFGSVVLKGEAVYTRGRKFGILTLTDPDGLAAQNTLDWAAGLDFTLPADTRFNVQLFQRVFFDHHPGHRSRAERERLQPVSEQEVRRQLGSPGHLDCQPEPHRLAVPAARAVELSEELAPADGRGRLQGAAPGAIRSVREARPGLLGSALQLLSYTMKRVAFSRSPWVCPDVRALTNFIHTTSGSPRLKP